MSSINERAERTPGNVSAGCGSGAGTSEQIPVEITDYCLDLSGLCRLDENCARKKREDTIRPLLSDLLADIALRDFWAEGSEVVPEGDSVAPQRREAEAVSRLQGGSGPEDSIVSLVSAIAWGMLRRGYDRLSIAREKYHVDPVFRDCYYTCYSRQHFTTPRHSQRLSFFAGEVSWTGYNKMSADQLQQVFIGSCVINPLHTGTLGRTLVDPKYLIASDDGAVCESACVHTSDFKVTVRGLPFHAQAFPYRSQDGLTLRCVEVTLVNLIEYYSNEYSDYGAVLPSQIHQRESELITERTIPAKGISYLTASKLLQSFRFQSRLHGVTGAEGEWERSKRVLHTYVDSCMPVAVNLATKDGSSGHSLLCIGYVGKRGRPVVDGAPAYSFRDTCSRSPCGKALAAAHVAEPSTGVDALNIVKSWIRAQKCNVYFSSDLHHDYIVMDDNQMPYSVRPYVHLSVYPDMSITTILVALHKGILLDARDAEDYIMHILSSAKTGVFNWGKEYLDDELDGGDCQLMVRLFLASSRRFKKVRVEQFTRSNDLFRADAYSVALLPHFVWVAELYLCDETKEGKCPRERAFAEIVLDATFGKNKDIEQSVAIWDYPDRIAFRSPDNSTDKYERPRKTLDSEGGCPDELGKYSGIVPFDRGYHVFV